MLKAARDFGYRPDSRARSLATGRSMAIGLVIPTSARHETVNPIFADFLSGASETLSAAGYDLVLSLASDEAGTYRVLASRGRVDGLIVQAPLKDDWRIPMLLKLGLTIVAIRGTGAWLTENEIACEVVNKVYEGGLTIVDRLKDGHIALVFNTTEGAAAVDDSRSIRAVALYDKIPYFTTAAASHAAVLAMQARVEGDVGVRSLQG